MRSIWNLWVNSRLRTVLHIQYKQGTTPSTWYLPHIERVIPHLVNDGDNKSLSRFQFRKPRTRARNISLRMRDLLAHLIGHAPFDQAVHLLYMLIVTVYPFLSLIVMVREHAGSPGDIDTCTVWPSAGTVVPYSETERSLPRPAGGSG